MSDANDLMDEIKKGLARGLDEAKAAGKIVLKESLDGLVEGLARGVKNTIQYLIEGDGTIEADYVVEDDEGNEINID